MVTEGPDHRVERIRYDQLRRDVANHSRRRRPTDNHRSGLTPSNCSPSSRCRGMTVTSSISQRKAVSGGVRPTGRGSAIVEGREPRYSSSSPDWQKSLSLLGV